MKILYKISLLGLLLTAGVSAAMAQNSKGLVNASCNELKQKGNELLIDAVININDSEVGRREQIEFTPVLEAPSQKMGLPPILINGKVAEKVYKRQLALDNYNGAVPFMAARAGKGMQTINYKMSIPYESWMKDARLVLIPNMCGCGKNQPGNPLFISNVVTRPDKAYEVDPMFVYVTPEAETVKNRAEVGTAFLDFQVGKYAILPDFRNNSVELAKIDNTITTVTSDNNITIKGLELTGYASPEGGFKFNQTLSENRVKALKGYIEKKHQFKDNLFTVRSEGEDWKGFKEAVESNPAFPNRDEVLAVINSNIDPDAKDAKIKKINNGQLFKYLLENTYPPLRRSLYKINYIVREFTVEEGVEIIKVHPEQLSLSEMFAVANTYEVGSKEFNEVFMTAVKYFPNDPVANINAANMALTARDLKSAEKYLEKAGDSAAADQARGVLALLKGDLDKAQSLFEKAQKAGIKQASENLKEVEKKRADNKLFESFE